MMLILRCVQIMLSKIYKINRIDKHVDALILECKFNRFFNQETVLNRKTNVAIFYSLKSNWMLNI